MIRRPLVLPGSTKNYPVASVTDLVKKVILIDDIEGKRFVLLVENNAGETLIYITDDEIQVKNRKGKTVLRIIGDDVTVVSHENG